MSTNSMTISAEHTESWLDAYQGQALPGEHLEWLQTQRSEALKHFENVGLPGIRDEQWRYTNLRALKSNAYALSAPSTHSSDSLEKLSRNSHPTLVFLNGFFRKDLSSLNGIGQDFTFCSLAEALTNKAANLEAMLETYFGKSLPKEQHGFTALNTAYNQDGYVLILPKGCVVEDTLEICFLHDAQTDNNSINSSISHSRNVIVAAANSQCTIVERHLALDESVYLSNTVTEIHAEQNAHVDHYKILKGSDEAFHMGGVFIEQATGSNVKNHNVALGGLVNRNDIYCNLNGRGAHIEMNGLVLGKNRQHVDNHTEVNHAVPDCTSDEFYKTILDDQSRSVFRGRIIVAQDAQNTNADQQNNNLLLSKHAEADCKPQLEIYADDVKCSHGATVGQLDSKSLFYLRSRGIDSESARALLTFAFANEVIERVNIASVREELTQTIAGQLLSGLEELL